MADDGYTELLDAPDDDGKTIDLATAANPDALPPEARKVSTLAEGMQFLVLSGWVKDDLDHCRPWRAEARNAFAFRAGDQWTEEDKQLLIGQDRPVIVFNRVLTILKAVAGMEINGRHEVSFLPRGIEDAQANEMLREASNWMDDSTEAEDEESEAFDHTATAGMGWTEERMSYEDDPQGLYIEECVDPLEMFWDRACKKPNMKGARRMGRIRQIPLGDAMEMFPGFTPEQIDASWAEDGGMDYPTKSIEEKRRRDNDNTLGAEYDDTYMVTVVHIQWIEKETYWLVADQMSGQRSELSDADYRKLKARLDMLAKQSGANSFNLPAVRMRRKAFKQAFLGAQGVMLRKAEPAPITRRYSWNCITGEFDKAKGYWFGLVRILRDPQMWANKWLSQILHILNTTAKGGVIAERDAFDDERDAEDSFAHADRITWAASGALSGEKPKIMPKPGGAITEGYVGLLTFAISSFKDVSGINLELLGQQDQNQPGILEMMRKQAGMTVLATLFNSLRRFRKGIGQNRLFFIQNFLSDGRLIRVAGGSVGEPARMVRLIKERTFGEYDVVVADTPTSPNQKEANWAIIQPLLVVFKEQLMANPEVLAMLLEYSPLPSRIVEAVKKFIAESANDPEQEVVKQLAVAKEMSEISKNESVANLNNAKAGTAQADAVYNLTFAQNLLADNKREELAAHLRLMESAAKAQAAEAKALSDASKARNQATIAAHKVVADQRKTDIAAVDAGTRRMSAVTAAQREDREARQTRAGLLIDHLATQSKADRDQAGAEKDRAQARLHDRTPAKVPAGAGSK